MSGTAVPSVADIRSCTDIPVFIVERNLHPMNGPVVVGDNTLKTTLEFAAAVKADVILVQYDYADMDDYYVDVDDYDIVDYIDEEEYSEISKLEEDRNNEVEGPLAGFFESAVACSVFVIYGGQAYGCFLQDDALIEKLGDTEDEFIEQMYCRYVDE